MARREPTTSPILDPGAGPGRSSALTSALDAASAERLRRVALRVTRDASAADDVVQSAFEKALQHAAAFRGEARPSTWLHRIVVNEALMWQRSEGRRRARLLRSVAARDPDEGAAPSPLDALLQRERRHEVQRALATLRREDAELLAHCALEERGHRAWALARGMNPAAVKTRAFRARRALRAALDEQQAASSQGPRLSR